MRMTRHTFVFVGAFLLASALAVAAPQATAATTGQNPQAAARSSVKAATHSTTGVVQSVSDTSLVIAKAGKGSKATTTSETFALNETTVKKGDVIVGAKVGVRYIADGGQNVATAVSVSAKGKGIPKSSR
jgi:hypothetical protein